MKLAPSIAITIFFSVVVPDSHAQNPAPTYGVEKSDRITEVCNQKLAQYKGRNPICHGFDTQLSPPSASYQAGSIGALNSSRQAINTYWYSGEDVYTNPFPYIRGMSDELDGVYDFGAKTTHPEPAKKVIADECEKELIPDPKPPLHPGPVAIPGNPDRREEVGRPLSKRMLDIVAKRFGTDSELYHWFSEEWIKEFHPKSGKNASDGSCVLYAKWALDPKVIESLEGITSGIMCDGLPLTKAEIYEIYYPLYRIAKPVGGNAEWYAHLETPAFFTGKAEQDPSAVKTAMDANMGLNKLGLLGSGTDGDLNSKSELDPGQLFQKFKQTILAGMGATFDRDHGAQVWNQPIVAMVETTYDSDANPLDFLSTSKLTAAPGQDPTYQELHRLEKQLVVNLAGGEGLGAAELSRLAQLAGTTVEPSLSLSKQADLLKAAKIKLAQQGKLVPTAPPGGVKVRLTDLTVFYGEEHKFAQMGADHLVRSRTYRIASVVSKTDPSQVIQSTWSPPTTQLSSLCKDKEAQYQGFSGWNPRYECCLLRTGRTPDFEVFSGAVPPRYVDFFDRQPSPEPDSLSDFNPDGSKKSFVSKHSNSFRQRALRQLQVMLMGMPDKPDTYYFDETGKPYPRQDKCPTFDAGAAFGKLFTDCERKMSFTPDEQSQLLNLVKDATFLDPDWVKQHVCKTGGVPGLDQLLPRLQAAKPDLCR